MPDLVHSSRFIRQRRFLLVLPLLVLPFLLLIFWALGGGKSAAGMSATAKRPHGLNLRLPAAQFRRAPKSDKLSLYEELQKDSMKLISEMKKDPYYLPPHAVSPVPPTGKEPRGGAETNDPIYTDSNAAKVLAKLAQLKAVIGKSGADPRLEHPASPLPNRESGWIGVAQPLGPTSKSDPELNQLESMLDKILAIQQSGTKDSLLAAPIPEYRDNHAVSSEPISETISCLDPDPGQSLRQVKSFFGLADTKLDSLTRTPAIRASIAEDQTLVSGGTVKLRLDQGLVIDGIPIPEGHYIYGVARLNQERLQIRIPGLRSGNYLLPVAWEVFDLDGMPGIFIPGSMSRDAGKESASQAIGSLGLLNLDPSLGAQAAGAGIEAVRSLLSKKIRLIRVRVEAGYRVLLSEERNRNR
jgi:hypothetical protein